MKIALYLLGGLLILVGAVWVLQGFNIFSGSAMSGHKRWVAIGGVLAFVGIALEILGARIRKR